MKVLGAPGGAGGLGRAGERQPHDVRKTSDLTDYAGELQVAADLEITDRDPLNSSGQHDRAPALQRDRSLHGDGQHSHRLDLRDHHDRRHGSARHVLEIKRMIWELGQTQVYDGGADGLAATPGNNLFAVQGVFVP